MKVACEWTGGLQFKANSGEFKVLMDAMAPLGSGSAPTPKQLLLMAVCACSGMDISAILKKQKQDVAAFTIYADADVAHSQPAVLTQIRLHYDLEGEVDPIHAIEAVRLSMTKYCSVSAMISKVTPIHYVIEINGVEVGSGEATFDIPS